MGLSSNKPGKGTETGASTDSFFLLIGRLKEVISSVIEFNKVKKPEANSLLSNS